MLVTYAGTARLERILIELVPEKAREYKRLKTREDNMGIESRLPCQVCTDRNSKSGGQIGTMVWIQCNYKVIWQVFDKPIEVSEKKKNC